MWTNRPSTHSISKDHAFDIELRTMLYDLWGQLPKSFRDTWSDHPDFTKFGSLFCFWWTNYQRWHIGQGPLLRWPEPNWAMCPLIDTSTCTSRGNAVEGEINFSYPGVICVLAIAFYGYHRFDVFSRGLKSLQITFGEKPIPFRFTNMRRGWQKGLAATFNDSGYQINWQYLPSTFCR